jgi:hypothetical protein
LITDCYKSIGAAEALGWSNHPTTDTIQGQIDNPSSALNKAADIIPWDQVYLNLQRGDVLFRRNSSKGHMVFFMAYKSKSPFSLLTFQAASERYGVGEITSSSTYDYVIRARGGGSSTVDSETGGGGGGGRQVR